MPTLRFIQLSDLHLGAPFTWLPADQRAVRRREQRRALEAAVGLAIERRAVAILLPGDLFDVEGVDAETLAFAVHAFGRDGCPPVFITPGNHDPFTTTSVYWNERLLAARGWRWPDHVHVFRDADWTRAELKSAPVTIWGRSCVSGTPAFERPLDPFGLPAPASMDRGRIQLGMFHGSREHACPPGQKITAPFSDAEALAAPFAYIAVGHYHLPSHVAGPNGGPRLAYAGSTLALTGAETGAHGVLEVRLDVGTLGVELEPIPLDERRVHTLDVDVTGAASGETIDDRIHAAMTAAGVSPSDIVRVRLGGRVVRGVRYETVGPELAEIVFSLKLDRGELRPDYDLEGIRAREPSTTEDRFAHALLDQLDAESDPARRARLLGALYYGLDAFRLREVAPAWEAVAAAAAAEPPVTPADSGVDA